MKKALVALLVILVIVAAAFLYLRRGHVYEVSQADIQASVGSQFPVEKCVLVFCIELSNPSVTLNAGDTRVEFESDAVMEVAFSKEEYDGSVGFSGALAYKAAQSAFYLDDSRLEHLELKGVSDKHRDKLKELSSLLVREYLRSNPIYSFKGTAFELIAPWLELKEVSMSDGILRLRIGLAL